MKLLFCALSCALLGGVATSSHAAPVATPVMQNLPVGPSYLAYVGSDNLDTLNTAAPSTTRDNLGRPMSIMFNGDRLRREKEEGYATMFATWAQTTLRVPLGWYAVESKDNVNESLIFSPGQSVKIVARAAIENQKVQSDPNAFEELKAQSIAQTKTRLQNLGLKPGPIERLDLPGEAFAISASTVTDKAGHSFSYLERFSQRSPKALRDEFFRTMGTGVGMSPLQLPLSLSLLAPADKFEKYAGLLGLMARDEGLNWSTERSLTPEEFVAQVPDAAKFNAVADEAVALIKVGDVAGFLARFPEAYDGANQETTTKYLTKTAAPFFAKLPARMEREEIVIVSDRDPVFPAFRATISRHFKVSEENFPTYVVAMERVNGRVQLLGVATTDDEFAG